ncbi:hypothetical protein PY32053_03419 [Paracoccus yeei]|uniref:Uncharacterized protein n=1 Tax=Paracoccus yeei TaxID=147645 RepID=A0A386URF4_9RHOB|nr:hypothetical protein PY32053_03419 [Paracoccus yeei]
MIRGGPVRHRPFSYRGRSGRAPLIEEAQRMPLIVLQNAL